MKVENLYPPNIDLIRLSDLKPNETILFCYGDTIYNPNNIKILPDVEYHEAVHIKQQGENKDLWWSRYLTEKQFRLEQEIEAYGEQYKFNKKFIKNNKLLKWRLEKMAQALSSETYGNLLNYFQAESKIRNYAKEN